MTAEPRFGMCPTCDTADTTLASRCTCAQRAGLRPSATGPRPAPPPPAGGPTPREYLWSALFALGTWPPTAGSARPRRSAGARGSSACGHPAESCTCADRRP